MVVPQSSSIHGNSSLAASRPTPGPTARTPHDSSPPGTVGPRQGPIDHLPRASASAHRKVVYEVALQSFAIFGYGVLTCAGADYVKIISVFNDDGVVAWTTVDIVVAIRARDTVLPLNRTQYLIGVYGLAPWCMMLPLRGPSRRSIGSNNLRSSPAGIKGAAPAKRPRRGEE